MTKKLKDSIKGDVDQKNAIHQLRKELMYAK